eukprot:TRINITY_DN3316_c0_g1_i1.p2 TRINITY_DN3316_c0_g1~~TRINITY_DN3316_c0_g1_i1.p2  ORF type:complete len:548 (-),score=134.29 TRINITY_DN3316_c0_g1_i1:1188-2831(-)
MLASVARTGQIAARAARLAAARSLSATAVASEEKKGSPKLWGGRFAKDTDNSVREWVESLTVDEKMGREDMWGSQAHVAMLGATGTIPAEDAAKILGGLLKLQDGFLAGEWKLGELHEDVHLNVEANLIKLIGMQSGGKMHTTRSRNDQVIVDSKMYTRRRLLELREKVVKSVQAFIDRAEKHTEDVMVGYTHVQHAQPISVAYWLSHYGAVMLRDLERLKRAYDVTDLNPLGSGAICTTSFPIDRQLTTDLLGFQAVHEHGLDATSARDYMLEVLSANAILQSNCSRLAEEFILWTSYEFRTLTLDDGFAMGSSMMPQKKNPGTLELMRGRMGRVGGLLNAGITMLKGLPSGYNRDFHEEKEILWASLDLINKCMTVVPPLVQSTQINFERMHELTFKNFATATELANFLVRQNIPFREAHHIVGSLVGDLVRSKENFSNFPRCIEHLKKHGVKGSEAEIKAALDPKSVMLSYNVLGGTGPKAMKETLGRMKESLNKHSSTLKADQTRVDKAYSACRLIAGEASNVKTAAEMKKLIAKYHPLQNYK